MTALGLIQHELKAPKGQFNKFGGFKYRSCEDILEALKPLLAKHGALLTLNDELVQCGEWIFIKSTATLVNHDIVFDDKSKQFSVANETTVSASAFARLDKEKKGMDAAQLTGSASSYARKYALNALFLIDDAADPDAGAPVVELPAAAPKTAVPPPPPPVQK